MHKYIEFFFWICISVVLYTYFGYGFFLFTLVKFKRLFKKKGIIKLKNNPNVTLLIVAYNEEDHIREKIENSLNLDYPEKKIQILVVTDGSDDRTPEIVRSFPNVKLMHKPNRRGKILAVERAMPEATGEIVVFTDANTLLNRKALKNIVRNFANKEVGVVAGEKRILQKKVDEAAGAGEGLYWRYESALKKWDDELCSVMGAAGELFAIRKQLFESIPGDSIIEDFYLSFKIIQKGYKIAYEPEAYALEEPSISVTEELKRKIRISAGGIQSIARLKEFLNPFKYGLITFQYISHRVLRWTLAPLSLPIVFLTNVFLLSHGAIYQYICSIQVLFYLTALIGYLMEKKRVRFKLLFIPFYFCMMNYAVFAGFFRYIRGAQPVMWEKASRRRP
ncbi:MAG: glycosyltransferase family 2 protein [Cytophagales bacterium]|nr:glycosyltransferase family 2 protein [Cytophagales bacterium]